MGGDDAARRAAPEGRSLAAARWQQLAEHAPDALVQSASEGTWIIGMGFVSRVVERPELPDGWEIVETLGAWHGLPSMSVSDIAETADGSIWLASEAGLIQVPHAARTAARATPQVALASVTVDGEPAPIEGHLNLPRAWSRITLRFAALSFRDPRLLRYRLRLEPDAPWQPPTSDPLFRFSAVAPGRYEVEVEGSLDGRHWSAAPARFSFSVPQPWYRRPWFLILGGTIVAGTIAAVARARLVVQLRLADQRMRIARDLHDQLGSGLASIGLLARVISRPDVASRRRVTLSEQIGVVSAELSASLSDIVWSLRPREANRASLVTHLAERASVLFPEDRPRLELDVPRPVPRRALSLAVRRNVLLIGLEALHNAARHSRAEHVRLSLAAKRRKWVLTVADDGLGMRPPAAADVRKGGGGSGIVGMRARAEEICAALNWHSRPGGGTEVRLQFSLFPREGGRRALA